MSKINNIYRNYQKMAYISHCFLFTVKINMRTVLSNNMCMLVTPKMLGRRPPV